MHHKAQKAEIEAVDLSKPTPLPHLRSPPPRLACPKSTTYWQKAASDTDPFVYPVDRAALIGEQGMSLPS